MSDIGLVLAGGGGKGAYQIGVWKYLHEVGLDRKITAVSGTSVGALNGALFAMGNLDTAIKLWENISPKQILSDKSAKSLLMESLFPASPFSKTWHSVYSPAQQLEYLKNILDLPNSSGIDTAKKYYYNILLHIFQSSFCFSRTGLEKIMQQIDFTQFHYNAMPCYAACMCVETTAPKYFNLKEYNTQQIKTLLLASSAIPYIFDAVKFNGYSYYDGGLPKYGDNIPIKPLYDKGIRKIIVVHLKQEAIIDHSLYPGAQILEIKPSQELGNLITGTLDFTAKGAHERMKLGEEDACSMFDYYIKEVSL